MRSKKREAYFSAVWVSLLGGVVQVESIVFTLIGLHTRSNQVFHLFMEKKNNSGFSTIRPNGSVCLNISFNASPSSKRVGGVRPVCYTGNRVATHTQPLYQHRSAWLSNMPKIYTIFMWTYNWKHYLTVLKTARHHREKGINVTHSKNCVVMILYTFKPLMKNVCLIHNRHTCLQL